MLARPYLFLKKLQKKVSFFIKFYYFIFLIFYLGDGSITRQLSAEELNSLWGIILRISLIQTELNKENQKLIGLKIYLITSCMCRC